MTEKTAEQLAAEQEAVAAKQAEKEAAAAAKAAAKAEAAAKKAADREAAALKKAEEKAAKEAAKAEAAAAKAAAMEAAKASRQQPEQNGVRRPKPETQCGRIWDLADKLSNEIAAPVSIAVLMTEAHKNGLLEDNTIKTQYARWRKFHGVVGRVAAPAAEAAPAAAQG